jgi:hypothetical protein
LVRLETDIKKFKEELSRLSWFMRGGVTLLELLHTYSYDDRESMYSVIKENIEASKTSQMPLI